MIGRMGALGAAIAAMLAAFSASAQELPANQSGFAGYVDVHGGLFAAHQSRTLPPDIFAQDWAGPFIAGAIRAGTDVGTAMRIQLDYWFDTWRESGEQFVNGSPAETFDGSGLRGGGALHLVHGMPGSFQFGALASIGGLRDDGAQLTIGAEMAGGFGPLRITAQGGATFGVSGDARADRRRALYAGLGATFYLTDDFTIGGNLGFAIYREPLADDPDLAHDLLFGARIEHRLGDGPASLYATYQGIRFAGHDADEGWAGMEHDVAIGIRFLFGTGSLREANETTGFADFNPIYGDPFAPR